MATKLALNEKTLRPADPNNDGGMPVWDEERRLLTFMHCPVLTDDWQEALLGDGRTVWVRSAACGLGCRCAGEYRMTKPKIKKVDTTFGNATLREWFEDGQFIRAQVFNSSGWRVGRDYKTQAGAIRRAKKEGM